MTDGRIVPIGNMASFELAMSVAEYFELDRGEARTIGAEVARAVFSWRQEAARHGLTNTEIDHMASAFAHEDLATALRQRA
jgi:serine/threonine-protein kinase HipA